MTCITRLPAALACRRDCSRPTGQPSFSSGPSACDTVGRRSAKNHRLPPRVARVAPPVTRPLAGAQRYHQAVPNLRIRQAAELLGVSDDTVRRWINNGTLAVSLDSSGRKVIASEELAQFSRDNAPSPPPNPLGVGSSARNRFVGLVTKVVSDTVMTQVEMQCGPFTVVSLMSTEAARELNLQPGSVAVAVVKATTVIVETAAATETEALSPE